MVEDERVRELARRLRSATSYAFEAACVAFVDYVRLECAASKMLALLDAGNPSPVRTVDAEDGGPDWSPTAPWKMPRGEAERFAFVWEKFVAVANGEWSESMAWSLYGGGPFPERSREQMFVADFLPYLEDAIRAMATEGHGK